MNDPHDRTDALTDAQLDSLLDASPDHAPSAQLLRRVAEIPIAHPRTEGPPLWPFASWWRALVSAGFALSLGALSSLAVLPGDADDDEFWELSTMQDDGDWDLEDMR